LTPKTQEAKISQQKKKIQFPVDGKVEDNLSLLGTVEQVEKTLLHMQLTIRRL
jgi:hypothetical protein